MINNKKQIKGIAKNVATDHFNVPVGSDGHSLRVLHIGNIANNAYYNAKFLRRIGVEADVLCYDDYWVMSSPEWEEADFEGVPADQYFPDWWALYMKGYQRPRWFVQGPFELCIEYLLAKQQGHKRGADQLWDQLTEARRVLCSPTYRRSSKAVQIVQETIPTSHFNALKRLMLPLIGRFMSASSHQRRTEDSQTAENTFHQTYLQHCEKLIEIFVRRFPERPDQLTLGDLLPYESKVKSLKKLFKYYDIVQGYAVDPLYPMLADFKPYTAFEHGTLRHAPEAKWAYKGPFYDTPLGRLTALSYALADHVFITNADCLSSAQHLQLTSFEPMPHPLDENDFSPTDEYREIIRSRLETQLVFFCPIRHDWIDKGTDRYIRALPQLRQVLNEFKVCFTPWGKEVERSRRLISELDCDDLVEWVGPFGRVHFARWLSAADVIFDQVTFPSFSGITPRALACGVPVISAYEPAGLEWMFPEPAPVLLARSVEEIVQQILTAVAPGFREAYRPRARQWIEQHHSSQRVIRQLLATYQAVLVKKADFSNSDER